MVLPMVLNSPGDVGENIYLRWRQYPWKDGGSVAVDKSGNIETKLL